MTRVPRFRSAALSRRLATPTDGVFVVNRSGARLGGSFRQGQGLDAVVGGVDVAAAVAEEADQRDAELPRQ